MPSRVVKVLAPSVEGLSVSALIDVGEHSYHVSYRASEGPISQRSDAFIPLALPAAMRLGAPLMIEGTVSPMLMTAIPKIQDILMGWDMQEWRHGLERVPVEASHIARAESRPGALTGCFFSGGVDSSYTAIKHRQEIDRLILVHGLDVPLEDTTLKETVREGLSHAASFLEKPLIEVETNLRDLSDRFLPWLHFFGMALTSVGLVLSPTMKRIYLAGERSSVDLVRAGSHPLLDPLWGTEVTEFTHDGLEATRAEKVERLAADGNALEWLRVCWENPDGSYNCGRCGKCTRTMAMLRAVGALERCSTFGTSLDLRKVRHMQLERRYYQFLMADTIKLLDRSRPDPPLRDALKEALRRNSRPNPQMMRRGVLRLRRFVRFHLLRLDRSVFKGRLNRLYVLVAHRRKRSRRGHD